MNKNQIAQGNLAFFLHVVGLHITTKEFASAVLQSFDEPVLYGIEDGDYSGYISVDSRNIKNNCSHGSFGDAVRGQIFNFVSMKLLRSVTGEMNTEAVIVHDIYQFDCKITKYERDNAHHFEVVDNPLLLPDDEHLGRFVELKITLAQQ